MADLVISTEYNTINRPDGSAAGKNLIKMFLAWRHLQCHIIRLLSRGRRHLRRAAAGRAQHHPQHYLRRELQGINSLDNIYA